MLLSATEMAIQIKNGVPFHSAECSTIRFHMRELTIAFNRLCNSTTDPEPNPMEWNSIPLTRIGDINTRTTATQTFQIPSTIPQTAKEVLVYAYIIAGASQSAFIHVKIFTEQSHTRRFEKYLSLQTWNQNAHTMTADNMWFPLTPNRRVYLSLSTIIPGNAAGHIYIIGYRYR